jgi:hypothetical protein
MKEDEVRKDPKTLSTYDTPNVYGYRALSICGLTNMNLVYCLDDFGVEHW